MPQFYTLLTDTGQDKMANAVALGGTIEITELAVGDGNGNLPTPDSSATALVNEVRRAPINASQTDPDNPSWIVVEQVLPPDVGGWTIREIGVYDVDGDLIGIGNYPETYKPVLAEGSSRTQTVRFVLEVSDTSAVTLKVDPAVVLATREYVDDERAEHEASRAHPAGTEAAQGMVRYGTMAEHKEGARSDRAAHLAGVLAAIHQFGLGAFGQSLDNENVDEKIKGGFWSKRTTETTAGDNPYDAYRLVVLPYDSSGAGAQIAISTTGEMAFRALSYGGWTLWREVYGSHNLGASNETTLGLIKLASQSKTDAGTDDSTAVTPKKLKNWAASWVKQATETVSGMLKVATQAKTDAGTDDSTAITPKKLRWGVSYDISSDGYIALPSWLGGLIIQWGRGNLVDTSVGYTSFPIAFPTALVHAVVGDASGNAASEPVTWRFDESSKTQLAAYSSAGSSLGKFSYLAIGY
ncbi:phage tail-collar fiber domain-containing protein [Halomonas sp. HG01]|uniref:phage tail-collar fiber domain-containing protein n=1 Tax=Halomonas sp. HG01 TaxID=1609967 RepID=UPI0006982416|nr:phage tail protein [Halomonas sp. HG01]